jgi:SAM-dependent methyltransferase
MVGALDGKSVLDLACGFGFYTRLLKQHGAAQVLGVDISPEMIHLAYQQEQAAPLGITYQICDAVTLVRVWLRHPNVLVTISRRFSTVQVVRDWRETRNSTKSSTSACFSGGSACVSWAICSGTFIGALPPQDGKQR